jgi:hypothetical protein
MQKLKRSSNYLEQDKKYERFFAKKSGSIRL